MKKFLLVLALTAQGIAFAQSANDIINSKEVERIERVLASDEMQGRKAGTPGGKKAAEFIASEFKKAGLKEWKGGTGYLQPFKMVNPKLKAVKGEINGKEIDPKKIVLFTTKQQLKIDEKSGYTYKAIPAGGNMLRIAYDIINGDESTIVLVDESHAANFSRLSMFMQPGFERERTVVFLLSSESTPVKLEIKAEHFVEDITMANVVGILPGKTKQNEYVIFSAHYDHLGIGQAVNGDSVYNGANDDASGTTAVIMLANYFKQLNSNERTIVFAAFDFEEGGAYGSQHFSKGFEPAQVMAMFNIEMIGTESKWGKNSAFITGYEKSDMGKILQENLKGSAFTFHPDPYPELQLFYRSDNATLARLGVPAHTISTSKMDSEKHYHTVDDEVETLDMQNMASIIKAIAESSRTIVAGKATPGRVNTSELH